MDPIRKEALAKAKEGVGIMMNERKAWIQYKIVYHTKRFLGKEAIREGKVALALATTAKKINNHSQKNFTRFLAMEKLYQESLMNLCKANAVGKKWSTEAQELHEQFEQRRIQKNQMA